jgi:hypothetical protein
MRQALGRKDLEDAAAAYSIPGKTHTSGYSDKQLYMNWVANQTALENYTDSVEAVFGLSFYKSKDRDWQKNFLIPLEVLLKLYRTLTRKDFWVYPP